MKLPNMFQLENSHASIALDLDKSPGGVMYVGSTGSGKTKAFKALIGRVSLYEEGSEAMIGDFKNDNDFENLKSSSNFFGYTDVFTAFEKFAFQFEQRQKGKDPSRNAKFLFVDEYGTFVQNLPKKDQETVKRQLATFVCLGRSLRMFACISTQSCRSDYFQSTATRDQISNRLLLTGSFVGPELKKMVFPDLDCSKIQAQGIPGRGYLYSGTGKLKSVIVPKISREDRLDDAILSLLKRSDF